MQESLRYQDKEERKKRLERREARGQVSQQRSIYSGITTQLSNADAAIKIKKGDSAQQLTDGGTMPRDEVG